MGEQRGAQMNRGLDICSSLLHGAAVDLETVIPNETGGRVDFQGLPRE